MDPQSGAIGANECPPHYDYDSFGVSMWKLKDDSVKKKKVSAG
jgi:hypothetical protein